MVAASPLALRHAMSSRAHSYRRVEAALEIACSCKLMLRPVCLVGVLPGCRDWQRFACCDHPWEELPSCLMAEGMTGFGCKRRQEGKRCNCLVIEMPSCLALGCELRRKGKLCECPRWPGDPCEHVRAKAAELGMDKPLADMTPAERKALYARLDCISDAWAERLWLFYPDVYADRPQADEGIEAFVGEAAVDLMTLRESWKLSLWHNEDVRYPGEDEQRRRSAGYKKLLRRIVGRKAVG